MTVIRQFEQGLRNAVKPKTYRLLDTIPISIGITRSDGYWSVRVGFAKRSEALLDTSLEVTEKMMMMTGIRQFE